MTKKILIITVVVALIFTNSIIIKKELILRNGLDVVLKLAPVDPRSLMQGDYMALNYEIGTKLNYLETKEFANGKIILNLDKNRVGTIEALYKKQKLINNQILLKYQKRSLSLSFATNAYFFQERTGETYEDAEYGQFKVDKSGNAILTGLLDENFNLIGEESRH